MDKGRYLVEAHLREATPVAQLARTHGVHPSWIYRLLARWRVEGDAGLIPRSRRPKTLPTAIVGEFAVTVGKVEEWPPEPEAFQLVVSAQAWHWVDADVCYSKAREVLPRDGVLALSWNPPLWEDSALRSSIDDVY